jgi:hypothetical protein
MQFLRRLVTVAPELLSLQEEAAIENRIKKISRHLLEGTPFEDMSDWMLKMFAYTAAAASGSSTSTTSFGFDDDIGWSTRTVYPFGQRTMYLLSIR